MGIDNINAFSSANIGMSSYQSITENAKTENFSNILDKAIADKDDEKLMESCREFEAYFVQTMYKEMLKTVDDSNSLFQKSQATEIFNDFLVEEYAKNISSGKGIGLTSMMYEAIKKQEIASQDPINDLLK